MIGLPRENEPGVPLMQQIQAVRCRMGRRQVESVQSRWRQPHMFNMCGYVQDDGAEEGFISFLTLMSY
ncbi:hypothetical protein SeMB42_g05494 [Synchytrium endobioticum]|uniref:Uncharacterized protein n=1 Tax=Synchytrium endobioticum TaxID=286115 RepID=A0A507CQI2_9FUNG|nr:hypothetical protein SeLEV6574_g06099 [Synchytrium endobioticum]TPX41631.1 hypothetical protein SeMB42_g05494 [Synchytrium endobioticum]